MTIQDLRLWHSLNDELRIIEAQLFDLPRSTRFAETCLARLAELASETDIDPAELASETDIDAELASETDIDPAEVDQLRLRLRRIKGQLALGDEVTTAGVSNK